MNLIEYSSFEKSIFFLSSIPCRGYYTFIITTFLMCIMCLGWTIYAPMDDTIKITATLRPKYAVSSIRCISSGEINNKNYINGQHVTKNQFLFSLDVTTHQINIKHIKEKIDVVENTIVMQTALLDTIQTNTLPKVSQSSETYIRSAAYIYEKKQYESTILDAETKLIRAKQQPSTFIIQQEIQDLQNHYNQLILQYEAWKNNQIIQANESYNQLTTEKNNLLSQLSDLERIVKNAIVMAPIDGYISEVKPLNTGDYIFSGEEIIRIIPTTTSNLKAELYVPSADIARIKKGDIVRIRFPGLPPSRYGQLQTTVNLVPPDFTLQEDGKAMFIVEADIHTPYLISKEGTQIMLQAGIAAEGRIVTERSTILHMILRKLDFL
ncbi:MAG: HlyD family efflux transporter periplasmic adaptor subunit [Candidatus Treponema excrementipullorum]|nr:HlyD family efflux transporter periplasmic adaptor subunit [Candidatus Treponema excrementipullorum]